VQAPSYHLAGNELSCKTSEMCVRFGPFLLPENSSSFLRVKDKGLAFKSFVFREIRSSDRAAFYPTRSALKSEASQRLHYRVLHVQVKRCNGGHCPI
jgi:hypothetical protein